MEAQFRDAHLFPSTDDTRLSFLNGSYLRQRAHKLFGLIQNLYWDQHRLGFGYLMKRGVTRRVREWLQHAKAIDELLETVAEEMEKSSALKRQLETEKGRCSGLEAELRNGPSLIRSMKQKV